MALIRIQRDPTPRQLRGFAVAWLLVFGFVAFEIRRRGGPALLFWPFAVGAVGVPLVGIAHLPVLKAAYLGLAYVTYPIGWVVSHVVLALVYYLVLTPIGLAMRLVGRDPLHRRFDPAADSYWIRRPPPAEPKRYLRQF